jgi:hypothetical protein
VEAETMLRSPTWWRAVPVAALMLLVLLGARRVTDESGPPPPPPPTATWQVEPPTAPGEIEGYASQVSVAPGDTLALHVSTAPAADYRVEFYRLGWYGGQGGTFLGCLPHGCATDEQGAAEPAGTPDPSTGELAESWPTTDTLEIPSEWSSGYYVAKLVLTTGPDAGHASAIPIIVRAPAGATADILLVEPVNTWQAYNDWGGLSLYSDPKSAVRVSFDRPYSVTDPKPTLEYTLVRFLDQFGYDVAYATDADVDANPAQLKDYRLVIFPAHSEYWTKAMRDGLEAARAAGVNLAFLGGNTGYWQIRYGDASRRDLVEYRSASADPFPDPRQKTIRWRDAPVSRPECALVGVQWQGADETSDPGLHDYRVVTKSLSDPWFAETGFKQGSVVRGAVGYEWDSVAPECAGKTPPETVLFHYEGHPTPEPAGVYKSTFHSTNADAVRYQSASGAIVFAAGSIDFADALSGSADGSPVAPGVIDPNHPLDPRFQHFMRNVIADLTKPRGQAAAAAR